MEESPVTYVEKALSVEAEDGLRLRCHLDFPPDWKPGGVLVVLLTGRAECLDKYDRVTAALLKRKVAVLRKDFRGQGGSGRMLADPQKGHVPDFSLYLSDLERVLEKLAQPLMPGKTVLMGHSMGSHVALRHLLSGRKKIDAAILESPMLSIDTRPLPSALARWISATAVGLGLGDRYIPGGGPFSPKGSFAGNPLTGDAGYFFRFRDFLIRHPGLQMGDPTLSWVHAAFVSMGKLWEELGSRSLETPILILSGERDRVVRPEDHERACIFLPRATYCLLEGARHEIYMERPVIRQQLWSVVDAFGKRVGLFSRQAV